MASPLGAAESNGRNSGLPSQPSGGRGGAAQLPQTGAMKARQAEGAPCEAASEPDAKMPEASAETPSCAPPLPATRAARRAASRASASASACASASASVAAALEWRNDEASLSKRRRLAGATGGADASAASSSPLAAPEPPSLLSLDTNLLLSLLQMLSTREQLESVLPLCRALCLSLAALPFMHSLVLRQSPSLFASFFSADGRPGLARACCARCCALSCFAPELLGDPEGASAPSPACGRASADMQSARAPPQDSTDGKKAPAPGSAASSPHAAAVSASAALSSPEPSQAFVGASSPAAHRAQPLCGSPFFPFLLRLRKCARLKTVDLCIPGSLAPSPLLALLLLRCAPSLRRLTLRGLDEGSVSWRMRRGPLEPANGAHAAAQQPRADPAVARFLPCGCQTKAKGGAACDAQGRRSRPARANGDQEPQCHTGGVSALPSRAGATVPAAAEGLRTDWLAGGRAASDSPSPSAESCAPAASCLSPCASSGSSFSAAAAPSQSQASRPPGLPEVPDSAAVVAAASAAPGLGEARSRGERAWSCASCESVRASAALLRWCDAEGAFPSGVKVRDLWLPARPLTRCLADATLLETLELDVCRRRGMYSTVPLAQLHLLGSALGTQALSRLRVLEICNATPRSFKCGAIALPSLQTLRLHFIEVAGDGTHDLGALLQGCPQLEHLAVHTDSDDDQMIFLNRLLIKSLRQLASDDSGAKNPSRPVAHSASGVAASEQPPALRVVQPPEESRSLSLPAVASALPAAAAAGASRSDFFAVGFDVRSQKRGEDALKPPPALARLETFQMMLLDLRVAELLGRVAPALRVLRLTEVDSFRSREGRAVLMDAVRRLRQMRRLELGGLLLEAEGKLELDALLAEEARARGWSRDSLTLCHGASAAHELFIPSV
ncbi:hypothetical protein BESB_011920 [Besnoitia besnoiti]|uniref:Uncharacterized protein n=1 Tax=Besnoitia besnoiti TaxID=94643 RepID=A0A2A9MB23_BESBE|nr:hypothetical protein BESB_011920 [Besnoitia besnoiti]PFH32580.1 hypothetical protein BESB_011920 [Besnoitia besnoiti]